MLKNSTFFYGIFSISESVTEWEKDSHVSNSREANEINDSLNDKRISEKFSEKEKQLSDKKEKSFYGKKRS